MNKPELVGIIKNDLENEWKLLREINEEIFEYRTPDDLLEPSRNWSVKSAVIDKLEWVLRQIEMLD